MRLNYLIPDEAADRVSLGKSVSKHQERWKPSRMMSTIKLPEAIEVDVHRVSFDVYCVPKATGMNMEKWEAKNAITLLFYRWQAQYAARSTLPDIRAFLDWLDDYGYGHYLEFQCETSPGREVRIWLAGAF